MRFFRHVTAVPESLRPSAVAIGNFDGVHRGHQAVIRQLVEQAGRRRITPLVMVFEPQPQEYFRPLQVPSRLTTLREKVETLRHCGVNNMLCLRFDQELAQTEPEEFVQNILARVLGARLIIVGDDFRFGHNRRGDFKLLRSMGSSLGFETEAMETVSLHGQRISSSRIRGLLAAGEVDAAGDLLGRPYSITGRVIHGCQRGRQLGFPTANIDVHDRQPPVRGIHAVQVDGLGARLVDGVASIGTRPVFSGKRLLLEVFLFDWNADIYGSRISVQFRQFLRPEMNFNSVDDLCTQMARDVEQARAVLGARKL
ncbi:MAG: riboflavin biosynthesis protein RibF [Gammaproteobacteria bacterium RIFCSPLOWO2_02_FULL_61_13]|nr:MAG: riboflavin biosynthesis protein RibF [Gammaproteobacteria bacterium RIFCSPLOWO2_02_FULL_61_13]